MDANSGKNYLCCKIDTLLFQKFKISLQTKEGSYKNLAMLVFIKLLLKYCSLWTSNLHHRNKCQHTTYMNTHVNSW